MYMNTRIRKSYDHIYTCTITIYGKLYSTVVDNKKTNAKNNKDKKTFTKNSISEYFSPQEQGPVPSGTPGASGLKTLLRDNTSVSTITTK